MQICNSFVLIFIQIAGGTPSVASQERFSSLATLRDYVANSRAIVRASTAEYPKSSRISFVCSPSNGGGNR